VFGGTIAVTAISYQMDRLFVILKVFYGRVIKGKKTNYKDSIQDLYIAFEASRKGKANLKTVLDQVKDPFVRDGLEIISDDYLSPDDVHELLMTRADVIFQRYEDDAQKFKAIGKFPPAMGLMGAVLGMIALLQTLGQPGAEDNVGPAMSIALVATLYGIAFANLIILPIADNLSDSAKELYNKNEILVEGLTMIAQRKNRILFTERINSFLLPNERMNWSEMSSGPQAKAS